MFLINHNPVIHSGDNNEGKDESNQDPWLDEDDVIAESIKPKKGNWNNYVKIESGGLAIFMFLHNINLFNMCAIYEQNYFLPSDIIYSEIDTDNDKSAVVEIPKIKTYGIKKYGIFLFVS